ncbi:MarR family winged helix-turn-helix transcriptional regulator [Anaerosporobacter sp.]|uniref:MarR family winged helix-turn-helix transcriptional regulator n=1 Tax=Anaerosporobacter sp. TaxID=1872529 RepID=UPI00286EE9E1|nr:MarR family transcriptional regulator [Anaerosporobacter sp.]
MKNIKNLLAENRTILSTAIAFGKAHRTTETVFDPTLSSNGLTPAQFGVLEALYSKGNLRIHELIDAVLTTSGNITVVLKNMERNSWISKTQDHEDKRACIISLTKEGTELIESVLPYHIKDVISVFGRLTEDEQATLRELLKKLE